MKVIISAEVVESLGSDVWKLHSLLIYACQGRHAVFFDSAAAQARCLETFDPVTRDTYAQAIDLTARASASFPADVATVRVEVVTQPVWDDPVALLPLDEAVIMLGEPLGVFVENAANDWSFLLGIMRLSERERMQRAVKKGWAEPLHGGGDTLKKQLQARLDVPRKGLRTFVMFDSDRLHPDELKEEWTPERPGRQPVACNAFEWEQIARENLPLRYWMLQRRFIESYMPESGLREGAAPATPPDAIKVFTGMSQASRWYFNMKNGFRGDSRRHDRERCRDLYEACDDAERAALMNGFGQNLADYYAAVNRKDKELDWDPEARKEASAAIPRLMRLL